MRVSNSNMYASILSSLPIYLMRIPAILIAITVHESAHAWTAWKLGDSTARDRGRISLNPLRHLDPLGVLMMLFLGFGFARPVQVDARRFKKPKLGMALTALAGPISNLLLGLLGVFVYCVALQTPLYTMVQTGNSLAKSCFLFLQIFFTLNIYLAIFNLIPIPPLDGSRVLLLILPERLYFRLMRFERYSMFLIFVLLAMGILDIVLDALFGWIAYGMFWLVQLLPFIH